jgi:hypothetical protein
VREMIAADIFLPPEQAASVKHCCRTCRWWDAHSIDERKGDCRAPNDHRYSHVPLESVDYKTGKVSRTIAYLDSFGREETLPGFVCGAWQYGDPTDLSI